jgi:hypothetical protein
MRARRGLVRSFRQFFGTPESELSVVSVAEYLALRHGADFLYRGHANAEWKLEPGFVRYARRIDKSLDDEQLHDLEFLLLSRFAESAPLFLRDTQPATLWEWLAVAQHYGLPTRLLDWTTSALTALYFAVESDTVDSDGAVWQLIPTGTILPPRPLPPTPVCSMDGSQRQWLKEVTEIGRILFLQPRHISHRVRVQHSIFTMHPLGTAFSFREPLLRKIVIPRRRRFAVRAELHSLGIHAGVIFPDLQGLTKEAQEWAHAAHETDTSRQRAGAYLT